MNTGIWLPVVVLTALFAVPSAAEVYKWVDESGQTHYGDTPLKSPAEQLEIDDRTTAPPSNNGMSREEMRTRLLQSMEEDRLEKQKKRAEREAKRKRNQRLCVQLRDNLRQLDRGTRLYNLDADGERVYISDTQREKHRQNTLAQIRKYCR